MGVERLLQRRLAELRLQIFLDRAADGGKNSETEPLGAEQGDQEEKVALVELKELLQSEAITENAMCWMQGFPDWCPIHSCREQLGLLDDGSILRLGLAVTSAGADRQHSRGRGDVLQHSDGVAADTTSPRENASHAHGITRHQSSTALATTTEPVSLQSSIGMTRTQRVPFPV